MFSRKSPLGSLNVMPGLGSAQEAHQRGLPVQEWEIAQIFASMLDQVEGVVDRGSSGLPMGQLLEPWLKPERNRLAADRKALGRAASHRSTATSQRVRCRLRTRRC
jgi:hypothetical protein